MKKWLYAISLTGACALVFVLGLLLFPLQPCLQVAYQKTGDTILKTPVTPGDEIAVRLTHSFEHIPWNEYYLVTPDLQFNLSRIEVAGYGAGIPAEMDVPTYVGEDGLVHMDNINTVFERFNWITSSTNMKDLSINGVSVLTFSDLPHHSFVQCEVILQRRFRFG